MTEEVGENSQGVSFEKERNRRTEKVRKPRVERLELLWRAADDEADDVPLGAEREDEGEATEGEHPRANGEGRAAQIPVRVVQRLLGESPDCRRVVSVSASEGARKPAGATD